MAINIKDYTPEFIKQQRVEAMQEAEAQSNKPMTYQDALHIGYDALQEKLDTEVDPVLIKKYEDAIAHLSRLFLRRII